LILFRRCNCLESGTRKWISILMTRLCIPPNIKRPVRSIWRTNTVPNTSDCQSINKKVLWATTHSPQQLQVLVNLHKIDTFCPVMIANNYGLMMWPEWHPDILIVQYAYWPLQNTVWINTLQHTRIEGKLIAILMSTTTRPWKLAVHYSCPILPTCGTSKMKHTNCTSISPMWHPTYWPSYHILGQWRRVNLLGKTWSDGGSSKQKVIPFAKMLLNGNMNVAIMGYCQVMILYGICRVLATGQGNPAAVRLLVGSSVQISSRPDPKPEPHRLEGVVTHPGHKPSVIWLGCTGTTVLF
jgi:hypothetical protein